MQYIPPPPDVGGIDPTRLMVVLLVLAVLFLCLFCGYKFYQSRQVKEREIITQRVLVVCPFCSTKIEQGISYCSNCGGKL